MDEVGGPLTVVEETEALTRLIVAWERSFEYITRFKCLIDTYWADRPHERTTVARALSRILRRLQVLSNSTRSSAETHGAMTSKNISSGQLIRETLVGRLRECDQTTRSSAARRSQLAKNAECAHAFNYEMSSP